MITLYKKFTELREEGNKLKKSLAVLSFILLVFMVSVAGYSDGLWTKYVMPGGEYSFYYPDGWKVTPSNSVIEIKNDPADEQLLMASIPFDRHKSPADLAAGFVAMLKKGNPNIRVSNWRTESETKDTQVVFDLYDQSNGKDYNGLGTVFKTENQATWFSYLAPEAGYSQARASAILQGFIGSLANGSAAKAPAIDYSGASALGSPTTSSAKIERNTQAFLFVLEFALGAPFTETQEQLIKNELLSGWKTRTEAELKPYDQYPVLMQSILKMGQKDLDDLRHQLEKTIKDWLATADSSDKAVKIIRNQLQARGRVVIAGNPPLTEMSLTAYSEIIAYSRLLRQNPKASPEQISQTSVNGIKKEVINAWNSFPGKDREGIATSPGWWICTRVLLENGSRAEQEKIRNLLLKLTAETPSANTPNNSKGNSGTDKKPMSMTAHWSLMQMQQMTFNHYMWSHGYNYSITGGKMW